MIDDNVLWAIAPQFAASAVQRIANLLAGEPLAKPVVPAAFAALSGEALRDGSRAAVVEGVAVLPVSGPIASRAGYGYVSYEDIRADLIASVNDDRVRGILLHVDSPGGHAALCDECAAAVRWASTEKPLVAHIHRLGASAAYWLASAAPYVAASNSALVGSVGVVIEYVGLVGMLERMGAHHVTVVSQNAPDKRFEPGSQEERDAFLELINDTEKEMIDDIARGRGVDASAVIERFGRGRVMKAPRAHDRGMIDAVQPFEATLSKIKAAATLPIDSEARLLTPFAFRSSAPAAAPSWGPDLSLAEPLAASSPYPSETVEESASPEATAAAPDDAPAAPPAEEPQGPGPQSSSIITATTSKGDAPMRDQELGLRKQLTALVKEKSDYIQKIGDLSKANADQRAHIQSLERQIDAKRDAYDTVRRHNQDLSFIAAPEDLQSGAGASSPPSHNGGLGERLGFSPRGDASGVRFESVGQFFSELYTHVVEGRAQENIAIMMSTTDYRGSEGHLLLPERQSQDIRGRIFSQASIRGFCAGVSMGEKVINYPVKRNVPWDPNNKSVKAEKVGTGRGANPSNIDIGMKRVELFKRQAIVEVPEEFFKFSEVLEDFIISEAREQIEWEDSYGIVWGNGNLEGVGWMNSGALRIVDAEAGQTADTIVAENIVNMYAAQVDLDGAFWMVSRSAMPQVALLTTKGSTEQIGIAPGQSGMSPGAQLLGLPVRMHETCKPVGDVGDIQLVNPSKGLFAPEHDSGVEVRLSRDAEFKNDKVVVKVTFYGGHQTDWETTVPARFGNFDSSHFVACAAR